MPRTMQVEHKNVGISILRLICAYLVLFLHSRANWGGKTVELGLNLLAFHVLCFCHFICALSSIMTEIRKA